MAGHAGGSVPRWLCAGLCAISFLLGRGTSPISFHLPDPPAMPQMQDEGPVFDDAWVDDPDRVLKTINSMCRLMGRRIGIGAVVLCHAHVLAYKKEYDYSWDSLDANRTDGYYIGDDSRPYQMDALQYLSILTTIAGVPSKKMQSAMEAKGTAFEDKVFNYRMFRNGPTDSLGPRVLFWGCGSDTPLHATMVEYLGGTITFIDNSEEYIAECKRWHPDIRLIEPTGTQKDHTELISKLVPQDGSGMETDNVEDTLTASQWMPDLAGVEKEPPWDVIVIDGPAEHPGRSQPLYMAKRLAQSYGTNHYTHVFLHDASRRAN